MRSKTTIECGPRRLTIDIHETSVGGNYATLTLFQEPGPETGHVALKVEYVLDDDEKALLQSVLASCGPSTPETA